jgi:hypothetical protein
VPFIAPLALGASYLPIGNRQSSIGNLKSIPRFLARRKAGRKTATPLLWCPYTTQSQGLSGGLNTLDHKMLGIILIPLESSPAQAALSAFSPSPVGISGPALIDDFMLE